VSRWPVAGPSEYWLLASSPASKVKKNKKIKTTKVHDVLSAKTRHCHRKLNMHDLVKAAMTWADNLILEGATVLRTWTVYFTVLSQMLRLLEVRYTNFHQNSKYCISHYSLLYPEGRDTKSCWKVNTYPPKLHSEMSHFSSCIIEVHWSGGCLLPCSAQ